MAGTDDRDDGKVASPLLRAISEAEKDAPGDALDLMRLLWTIEHNLQIASRQTEGRIGVTGPQLAVLKFVGLFPGISAGKLSEILRLHPSTLTGVFKRLVAKGALARNDDPADGRRAIFHLTAMGRELIAAQGTIESSLQRVTRRLPAGSLRAAEAVLQAIADELEADFPSTGSPGEGQVRLASR